LLLEKTDILSVFGLKLFKNLTRWLGFLTVVKHWAFGTGFAWLDGASEVQTWLAQNKETFKDS